MPQNSQSLIARNANNVSSPLKLDTKGNLLATVAGLSATKYAAGISTATNIVSAATPGAQGNPAGYCVRVNIITAGSTAGSVNDCAGTSGANGPAITNQLVALPNTVGVYTVEFPYLNGLTVVPGTGQVLAVAYS